MVLGLLRMDGSIDCEQTARLVELAQPMSVTFHKAFDQAHDPEQALETLIALGVDRVLTSGCRPTAREGSDILRRLVDQAGGRIVILAGGRIKVQDIEVLLRKRAFVKSISARPWAPDEDHDDSLADRWIGTQLRGVDPGKVGEIVELVERLSGSS